MTKPIDLRSDTVTKPSEAMMDAMFVAELGDDVFGEDPTVNYLEKKGANLFGKEAALFCPSGTMTNQIAIKVHTKPGDEVICDVNAHIYQHEGGGLASNSGVQAKLLLGDRGRISAELIAANINAEYDWLTRSSVVSLENTVNKAGGSIYTNAMIKPITELCAKQNMKLHLDGARIFNALVETNESASEVGALFDSISICLSKGLGAPVGSLLLGTNDFIKKARKRRKVFGGGMRQAGFLAAAGIYALENNVKRLKDDHARAKEIGKVLTNCAFVSEVLPVETNIVIFNLAGNTLAADIEKKLADKNIRCVQFGKQTIRFVTHLDFTDDMLAETLKALKSL